MGKLRAVLAIVGVILALGLSGESLYSSQARATEEDDEGEPGALVRTTAESTVGVLLDEIPPSMRGRVAKALMDKPQAFWKQRAAAQLRLTSYRLVFREFFYNRAKKQLPLPPEPLWQIKLVGTPSRQTVNGHDVVAIDYQFSSVLLTDAASPEVSEPRLSRAGGTWREPFIFPIDPEMLLQRTGYACMDEDSFPFNSVDSEEVDSFYDHDCVVEDGLGNQGQCHYTQQPAQSCVKAIRDHVGRVDTEVTYERLGWDDELADDVRYGEVTGEDPDLQIYLPDFLTSRITYRYIHDNGCEVAEDSVSGTGWRRLLQFATSDENVGNRALEIGSVDYTVSGNPGDLDAHHLYEYSACHDHFHFKYYGDFGWTDGGNAVNGKLGFCLQSTARVANREGSPLHHPYASCDFQGVEAGWVDQYKAGLPSQWLDVTEFSGRGERSFTSNPNGFLCEGQLVDENGDPLGPGDPVVWGHTGLTAEDGHPVEAPLCELSRSWDANNAHETVEQIPLPGEGLITTACTRGQIGPLRNCGFRQPEQLEECQPGQPVTVTLSVPKRAAAQVARICEASHGLNSAIPCRYEDSYVPLAPGVSDQPYTLANAIVTASSPTAVTFTCPSERTGGADEPGGWYAIYTGPVFPDDAHAAVTQS